MANDVFGWCATPGTSGDVTLRVRTAQFGDGYSQAVGDGINTKVQSWPLTFRGKSAVIKAIASFLDAHGGWDSFLWTDPLTNTQNRWRAGAYTVQPMGADAYTLSVTFQQVWQP